MHTQLAWKLSSVEGANVKCTKKVLVWRRRDVWSIVKVHNNKTENRFLLPCFLLTLALVYWKRIYARCWDRPRKCVLNIGVFLSCVSSSSGGRMFSLAREHSGRLQGCNNTSFLSFIAIPLTFLCSFGP